MVIPFLPGHPIAPRHVASPINHETSNELQRAANESWPLSAEVSWQFPMSKSSAILSISIRYGNSQGSVPGWQQLPAQDRSADEDPPPQGQGLVRSLVPRIIATSRVSSVAADNRAFDLRQFETTMVRIDEQDRTETDADTPSKTIPEPSPLPIHDFSRIAESPGSAFVHNGLPTLQRQPDSHGALPRPAATLESLWQHLPSRKCHCPDASLCFAYRHPTVTTLMCRRVLGTDKEKLHN